MPDYTKHRDHLIGIHSFHAGEYEHELGSETPVYDRFVLISLSSLRQSGDYT
jgi:hypothetical protein